MNKDNVLKVADAIERHSIPDLGFNMRALIDEVHPLLPDRSGHNCGTVACIAGWAVAVEAGDDFDPEYFGGVMGPARAFLGLTNEEGNRLFSSVGAMGGDDAPRTPAQAVAVLHHLAETGEVDWSVAATPSLTEVGRTE